MEAISVCWSADLWRQQVELAQRSPPLEEAVPRAPHFPWSRIFLLCRCGPVKRQGVNAVHCCLKHTLLFSNFTIVRWRDQKGPFQHVAAFNELSCLTSLLENFSLIEPRSERSLVRQWGRTTFTATQWRGNKDVVSNPSRDAGPPRFTVANRPVNYSKTPKSEDL